MTTIVRNPKPNRVFSNNEIIVGGAIYFLIVGGTFHNILSYLALIASIVVIMFCSQEKFLSLLMFIMPFATIFKASPNSQSFFTYLTLVYVLFCVFKNCKIDYKFLSWIVIFAIFLVFQMFLSFNILRTIKFVFNVLLIYFATSLVTSENDKKIYVSFILGIVISSITAYINVIPNLTEYIGAKDLGHYYDEMVRFSGLYADPNYYSINVIISLCLAVILNCKNKMSSISAALFSVILLAFAIMTYSKSAFLILILPLSLLLYFKFKNRQYIFVSIIVIAFSIFAMFLLSGKIEALNIVLSRITESNDLSTLTTGRLELWLSYLDFFKNNILSMLFGVGFGGELVAEMAAHNSYIDMIYYLGLLGSMLLISLIVRLFKYKQASFKKNILNYSILIVILIMYFFLSELFYFDWAFHFIIAILVFKTNFNKSKKEV